MCPFRKEKWRRQKGKEMVEKQREKMRGRRRKEDNSRA